MRKDYGLMRKDYWLMRKDYGFTREDFGFRLERDSFTRKAGGFLLAGNGGSPPRCAAELGRRHMHNHEFSELSELFISP